MEGQNYDLITETGGSASKSFVWLCGCDVAVECDALGCTLAKLAASL